MFGRQNDDDVPSAIRASLLRDVSVSHGPRMVPGAPFSHESSAINCQPGLWARNASRSPSEVQVATLPRPDPR